MRNDQAFHRAHHQNHKLFFFQKFLRAIHKYNAEIIEFHLDLDKKGKEFKFGHCWLPNEINQVILKFTKTNTC